MEERFSLLFPEHYDRNREEKDAFTSFDFMKDLGLNELIVLRRDDYMGLRSLELKQFFTRNPEVIAYRLDIVEDLLHRRKIFDTFVKALPMIQNIRDMRRMVSGDDTVEGSLSAIRIVEMFLEIVDRLEEGFAGTEPESEGLVRLQEKIRDLKAGDSYTHLKEQLAKIQFQVGHIKSVTIGVNLDGTLHASDAGVVSVNTREYRQGNIMERLLKPPSNGDSFRCITSLVPCAKGIDKQDLVIWNRSIQSAINRIFSKAVRSWEPVIRQYFSSQTDLFVNLSDDLWFLTSAVKFLFRLKDSGQPLCKPEIRPVNENAGEFTALYNPMITWKLSGSRAVANDFTFDEKGRFYLITGPNHGGKSVFMYSVGIAQALFQLGLFVPASHARISPVHNIFTHFPTSDENNYGKGRLESECARLRHKMEMLTGEDMILLDESFSSTSGSEASYIASEIITAFGIIGCRGLFVTHIHDLPLKKELFNSHPRNQGKIDNLSAQMEDRERGVRSYRLLRKTPDGLSYAKDIAEKYGLSLEGLLCMWEKKEKAFNKEPADGKEKVNGT